MNHSNMYAVGLALCTFANIASEEMSRDLANEIEKLLGSSNTYIRKKVRILLCPCIVRYIISRLGLLMCSACYKKSAGPCRPFHKQSQEFTNRPQSWRSAYCDNTRNRDVPNRSRIPK